MPVDTAPSLTLVQRRRVVDQALALFSQIYVHLPLKEAMHAVRPVQRLRLLRDELNDMTARQFHSDLLEIFNSVRDLHTNYMLPDPPAKLIKYLPFKIESYFENKRRRYAMTHWIAGFSHETFVPGVEILHWGGIPIARAVEISGEQHAGSNRDARHSRGVAGLTMRPLVQALPPDMEWVDVRYRGLDGKVREERFEWREFKIEDDEDAAAASGEGLSAAAAIGLDLEQDLMRRASKKLFVPKIAEKQESRKKDAFPFPDTAPFAAAAAGTAGKSRKKSRKLRGPFPPAAFTAVERPPHDRPDHDRPDHRRPPHTRPQGSQSNFGFSTDDWPHTGAIPLVQGGSRPRGSASPGDGAIESFLPHVFDAHAVGAPESPLGYIRIRTFSVRDEWEFLSEFVRLAALLPQRGLIIDVRGNGGGLILAGELILQTLTPRRIEPERVQFINTPATRALIAYHSGDDRPFDDFDLGAWKESAEQATRTGATYTQAFPITDPAAANLVGQQYHGPVTLITDARCYSTTDIFAAGFQDHGIGPIVGVDGNTGAGGANVWTHDLLSTFFDGMPDNPIKALPKGIAMRVAIRRTLRSGEAAGTPVEDLGVVPNLPYFMTRRDLMEGNVDLTEFAATTLADRPVYGLEIQKVSAAGNSRRVTVQTEGLDRLDVYLDDRPLHSLDVSDGAKQFSIPPDPKEATLDLRGFKDRGLAAARRGFLS